MIRIITQKRNDSEIRDVTVIENGVIIATYVGEPDSESLDPVRKLIAEYRAKGEDKVVPIMPNTSDSFIWELLD